MSVAGVVVTHGPDPELARAVASLGPQVDELVVVANPPAPVTEAPLIVNERPLGFAANVNKGVAATSAPFVVVANPDTEPRARSDREAARVRRGPSARRNRRAAARLPGRKPQSSRRRFPTVSGTIVRRTPLRRLLGRHPAAPLRTGRAPDRPVEADWLLGAFLVLRREMLEELGGLDEGFRLYGEDIDLAYRADRAGWERWYVPDAVVRHAHQAVTDKRS